MKFLSKLLCWLGCHRWDCPGGHCEECGACDEFFHEHSVCRRNLKYPNPITGHE